MYNRWGSLSLLAYYLCVISAETIPEEQPTEFWVNKAQANLAEKIKRASELNTKKAKNIIFFLGDGMSVHTTTATRIMLGDYGKRLSFEAFPYTGLSKTYSLDMTVPDSGSTATAYLSGVKANSGTIGVTGVVSKGDCFMATDRSTHTESIAKWAQDAGKWAGLVTTATVTHATPAGFYAHTAKRTWENDAEITKDGCNPYINVDIARQLVEWPVGKSLRVIMGGGRSNFIDKTFNDEDGQPGLRRDGRNLTGEWLADKNVKGAHAQYVWNKEGLSKVNFNETNYLLGLFSSRHGPFHRRLSDAGNKVPSLCEMTEAAIKLLSQNDKGYFLFIEGAKIDMAHHDTHARLALEETAEFARAVELARNMTKEEDTLIVVTADHSHTMTISGYGNRGNDIFGLAPHLAGDGLPYTLLAYANGPSYLTTYSRVSGRRDLRYADFADPNYQYPAAVPLESETHGGEDVGIYASGPCAQYFIGNYEQSYLPALMAHAADIGPFSKDALAKMEEQDNEEKNEKKDNEEVKDNLSGNI